jgi:hypothetical protein
MSHPYQHHRENFALAIKRRNNSFNSSRASRHQTSLLVFMSTTQRVQHHHLFYVFLWIFKTLLHHRSGVSLLDGNRTQGRARTREVPAFGDSNHFAISIHAEEDIEEQGKRKDWRKERRNEGEDMEGKRGASP